MEDLYSNQEARLRFEAYRYKPSSCNVAPASQRTHVIESSVSLQPLASFCCGFWRKPGHPRDCCHRRPGELHPTRQRSL